MAVDLITRARAGDDGAFAELIEPYRRELHLHCYRILGSFHDAEDAMQETLTAAWQGLAGFEARSSLRTWLYRVATSRALNARRSGQKDARWDRAMPYVELPPATDQAEVNWIEPYPDALLDGIAERAPGPEARYEIREAVSLAFITALQLLPPRQRAVHILRDVLGFHTREVSHMLDSTEESVTSALKRVRATLQQHVSSTDREPPAVRRPTDEVDLVERFTQAFESDDIQRVVDLLTHDVWIAMPPLPGEWHGLEPTRQVLRAVLEPGRRLLATRANGQPAFGLYLPDRTAKRLHAAGLLVLTLAGQRVSGITRFDTSVLTLFDLPAALPA